MGKYAKTIVELAQSWIGRNESAGTHKYIIDIYNAHKPLARNYKVKYTDEWCATTISALAIKCGYTDIIPTECSCQRMIELFKKLGSWIENESCTPKTGWIIFYDWQDSGSGDNTGWSDHVGIVEKVSGSTITVIEGNNACSVRRRTLAVNGKYIRGYGAPKYDAETSTNTSTNSNTSTKKSIDAIAKEVIEGNKWGTGADRKKKLEAAGYDYEAVQKKVNELLKGTSTNSSAYYPKYTGNSYGIDTVLAAIGVHEKMRGNYKNRKTIATVNGILSYTGTAAQNTKLISLAKQGKLKRP